jgi:hypothetical protein
LIEKAIKEHLDEGEPRKAWNTMMEWNEWLQSTGEQERAPDKSEASQDIDLRRPITSGEAGCEVLSDSDKGIRASPARR